MASPNPGMKRAAAWAVAAALGWTLPSQAVAAPPADDAQARPAKQKPTLPDPPPTATPDPEPDADPDPGADADPDPEPDPEPDADADADADPEPDAEPDADPDQSFAPDFDPPPASDRLAIDAAWEGVHGYEVKLELVGGERVTGRVAAVQPDTFTLIESETGRVLVLPKSGVRTLRVRMPPPVPENNGIGLIVGGAILTTFSSPVLLSGIVFLGICPDCVELHMPMLVVGIGGLAGSIPMIVIGRRRHRAFAKALQERGVQPVAGLTRDGWTGGVRFRF